MPAWVDRILESFSLGKRVVELESALKETQERLEEASALASMYDPDLGLTAAGGGSQYFRRLTQSPRDFAPLQHQRMQHLAYYLYETNPIARRILGTTAAYLIGDGIKAKADYQEESMRQDVQDRIDGFWDDHVNLMDLKLPVFALELGMMGELCISVHVNPVDGLVRLDTIDPENVTNIVTKGSDLIAIEVTPIDGSPGEERFKVIHVDEDPNSPSFDRLVGAETDAQGNITETYQKVNAKGEPVGDPKKYIGSCFFFRVNNISNAKRGRSDLIAVIDWLDAYDQQIFTELERAQLLKNFIWDVQLNGFNADQITAWLKENGSPRPGAVRAHNEQVTWNAVSPDLKTSDQVALSDVILGHISTGAQYPKTWLNVTDTVNKATSQTLDEPTFRWMNARQKLLRFIVEQLVRFQLDQAELAGELSRPKMEGSVHPEPWQISTIAPELRQKDLNNNAQTLQFAVTALVAAITADIIDVDVAQEALVLLIEQLGVEVDIDEMRDRLEKAAKEKELQQAPPVLPPDGAPGTPGASQEGQGTTGRPGGPTSPANQPRPALAPPVAKPVPPVRAA
jgi:hypothetical protein